MTWRTHIIGGAQIGMLTSVAISASPAETALITGSALIGSVLPDIDHTKSKISRNDSLVGILSYLLSKVTKHRGFTHTVFGAITFAFLFYGLAVFKTEKESLIATFAAVGVFVGINAFAGALRPLAGWLSVITYSMGPQIAGLISDHNLNVGINTRSALVCAIGIFAGCISHYIYDSFNAGGIPWLWPVSKKSFRFMAIKTNSASELIFNVTQIILLSAIIATCYKETEAFVLFERIIENIKALA